MSDYVKQARDTVDRATAAARKKMQQARETARESLRAATYAYRTVTGGTAGRALERITSGARSSGRSR